MIAFLVVIAVLLLFFIFIMYRKGLLFWYEKWITFAAIVGGTLSSLLFQSIYPMGISIVLILLLFVYTAFSDDEIELVFIYPVNVSDEELARLAEQCIIGKYKRKTVLVARTVDENLRLLDVIMDSRLSTKQEIVPAIKVKIISEPTTTHIL